MNSATDGVRELLVERLTSTADPAVHTLVLAAFDGRDDPGDSSGRPLEEQPDSPRQVFLNAIHVEGFRGIGPRKTLQVTPGPGLTLVTGRNGSGKSSFAEAAEVAMTGDNERWSARTSVWREGWRNLHHDGPATVAVDLVSAHRDSKIRISRSWQNDKIDDAGWWIRTGQDSVAYNGDRWRSELVTYRPFLSYSELGKLINSKPSELYDSVFRLLGLESLSDTRKRLQESFKQLNDAAKIVTSDRKALLTECTEIDDPRAAECARMLQPAQPDLARLAGLVAPGDANTTAGTALRRLAELPLPGDDLVKAAVERLSTALGVLNHRRTADVSSARDTADLLRRALLLHESTGDGPCPVCAAGHLDQDWRVRATTAVTTHESVAAQLRAAELEVGHAQDDVRELIAPIPAELAEGHPGVDTTEALAAWREWRALATLQSPEDVASQLWERHHVLSRKVRDLRAASEQELTRRNEVWQPFAGKLLAWLEQARQVAANAERRKQLHAAQEWIKKAWDDLRDQRVLPYAEAAQRIWHSLRQQSNVDLGKFKLAGGLVQRKVDLEVQVDGSRSAALGVMSQGELHALALSLFLPRATVEQSPFRFVMIDDPVQAMDPAKVDGLARVLSDLAEDRQVIVFTHDDRLAEAVRRQKLPATIWEVVRGEQSRVELRAAGNPVKRYLADARAVARTTQMPAAFRCEIVVSMCRSALDAVSHQVIRSRRLSRGERYHDVDDLIETTRTTHEKLTLAVFDDPTRNADLYSRIKISGPRAVETVQACKQGAHRGYEGDLGQLIKDTEALASWVERQ
ncbi:recombinational DNA repair ATPase RecF [Kibdelosporangium banguiense]|uniref:Nuclease SbcCD subunit C n=1 Tax=Kibdelosporangium banguiense TaxID=1365924 RepID=A0ABS4TJ29_9PSEU|nr:AAA family ATPase [Kibdelosporangium banguiense]MBP2324422.1 recombinational DNA repair ATPase RecF [Kibdelosporangium banguiense]